MKRMLITGVSGFIGRSAVDYFKGEYEITGIDLGESAPTGLLNYYTCNMSKERDALLQILNDSAPDVVLHCAGSANVGASVLHPMEDLDGNLHSLYALLLAFQQVQIRPEIIFFSSAAVYGNPKSLPIRETDAPSPVSPYGLHKLMCEQLCSYYNRLYGFRIRSVRVFSAYGNGLKKQILWDMYQKFTKDGHIRLFGTGDETRDFIHVSDIMRAVSLIIDDTGGEEIFNVANGEEISIRHLAETYAGKLGEDDSIVSFNGEGKEGDPRNWRADITLLKSLGYQKTVEIGAGIDSYVDWVRGL